MSIDTYVYVGPYVVAPIVQEEEIKTQKMCSSFPFHSIEKNQDAAFCSTCGASLKEVEVSKKMVTTTLSIIDMIDNLTAQETQSLTERLNVNDLNGVFDQMYGNFEQVAWYISDERIKTKCLSTHSDTNFIDISDEEVVQQKSIFSALLAPLGEIIENKYHVTLHVKYGVFIHYG